MHRERKSVMQVGKGGPRVGLVRPGALRLILATAVLLLALVPSISAQRAEEAKPTLQAGIAALKRGDFSASIQALRQVIQREPGSAEAYLNLGLAYYESKNYEQAIETLGDAVKLNPRLTGGWLFLGISQFRTNHVDDAIRALERAVRLSPRDPQVWLWLGVCRSSSQNLHGAATALEKAVALDPRNVDARYHLGHTYLLLSQTNYHKIYEIDPDSWRIHQVLAQADAEAERNEEAIVEYQVALKKAPDDAEMHAELGRLYWKEHNSNESEREFLRSLDLDPGNLNALYQLGSLYLQVLKPDLAAKYLRRALSEDSAFVEARYNLGRALASMGDDLAAEQQFRDAMLPDQNSEVAQLANYQLFLLYRRAHKSNEAARALTAFQALREHQHERQQKKLDRIRTSYELRAGDSDDEQQLP